ncbi:MAG TPA: ATP synthase F1 subunit gamma [Candidatus Paceibacterota bacterium]|nr:ATP synthase F1 subunit gamma [Candidatus Paceibacterota bacterium]
MESTQNLQRRMKSVGNIGQITKAMELVAATKMRRSQELALGSRPYAYTALEIMGVISRLSNGNGSGNGETPPPELLTERPVAHTALMVVTSDKGLAGSFNASVLRRFEQYVRDNAIDLSDPKYVFIAVGQKAKSYLEHRAHAVSRSFVRVGDFTRMAEIDPISEYLIDGYLGRGFDEVISFATHFVTALRQEVFVRQLLPISAEKIKESAEMLIPASGRYSQYIDIESFDGEEDVEYLIEPSPREVLEGLSRELLKIRVYHNILEANASEHSARRVAMKNASDNASDLSQNLSREYNKSRQAAITNQIIEVTSGAQSMQ